MKLNKQSLMITLLALLVTSYLVVSSPHLSAKALGEIGEIVPELHPDNTNHYEKTSLDNLFTPNSIIQRANQLPFEQNKSNVTMSPVDVVKSSAELLGLSSTSDRFYLTANSPSIAMVQVFHQGKNYMVTLLPVNGSWIVSSINPE